MTEKNKFFKRYLPDIIDDLEAKVDAQGEDLEAKIDALQGEEATTFPRIVVTADWSTPLNAWADIKESLGIDMQNLGSDADILCCTLWNGIDDWACLKVENDGTYVAYKNLVGTSVTFNTPPTDGYAYLMGVTTSYASGGPA